MKKSLKKAARLLAGLLALCLTLTGCSRGLSIFSNYRRLEMVELVRTITVDGAEDGVNVAIYGTAGEKQEARMYQRTGPSVGVAMNELSLLPLGREAVLSHTEELLIGEDVARERLDEVLDYVERFSETRLDIGLLVVRDSAARELVSGLAGEETPASDVLAGLSRSIDRVGQGYIFSCREIVTSLAQNGVALIQCVRGVQEEKLFENRGDLNLAPAGFAVARPDAIVDFLTEEETLGTMLLLGKYRSKNVDIPVDGAVLTLSVDSVKPEIKPVFSRDGALERVEIRLTLGANVVCMAGLTDLRQAETRHRAEDGLSQRFGDALTAAVKRGQAMGIDFLDLYGILSRREPLRMEDAVGKNWDTLFPGLPVEIAVESTLSRTYDIIDPPEISGREEGDPWEKLTGSLKDN